MVIEFTPADSGIAAELVGTLDSGRSAVEAFFGGRYRTAFTVRIYPSRAALTAHWARAWGVPDLKTECWMVASGVGDELALLSPRVWGTEACEHAVADTASTRRIFWHELVHVYHGQHNPRPTFDGMDDLGWFVEGVAVLASGQRPPSTRATRGRRSRRIARQRGSPTHGAGGGGTVSPDRWWDMSTRSAVDAPSSRSSLTRLERRC